MERSAVWMIVMMVCMWGCTSVAYAQDSPHGPLSVSCENCHDTDSWNTLASPMKFSHASTGFALEGRHTQVACKQCHATLRFSATPDQCAACHQDVHRKELGSSCERCHSPASWLVPDMPQRHISTRFALLGAHRMAQCQACHTNQQKHTYAGAPLECVSCHRPDYDATTAPPHRSSGITTDCESCHSVSALSWGRHFDHSTTGFTLVGAHATATCAGCHQNNVYKGLTHDCYGCHAAAYNATKAPPHRTSGIAVDCASCHSPSKGSWGGTFDHAATGFPLAGAHAGTPCVQCHKNNVFTGLPSNCYSCHATDYTGTTTPPHQASGIGTDCATCHSASSMTWGGKFDHSTTAFPLTGSHVAVACLTCHKNGVYKGLPMNCYSCHAADYNGTTTPPHQPSGFSTDCVQCHASTATTWGGKFNHSTTSFPLNGSHAAVPCLQCHKNNVFKGLSANCYSCHTADYTGTTKPPHQASGFGTDCVTCHSSSAVNWAGSFNHALTGFSLTGKHATATCVQCHVNNVYKGLPSTCVSCHQQDYNASTNPNHASSGFPTTCETCHSTTAWAPSTFNHEPSFPISSTAVHRPGRWSACADCHTSSADFRVFSCLNCHEHAKASMDSKHSGNSRYSYTSSACYSCHPRGRE